MKGQIESAISRFSPKTSDFELGRMSSIAAEGGNRAKAEREVWLQSRTARAGRLAARLLGVLMLAVAIFATPAASQARVSVGIAVSFGPPAIPIYYQPPCPGYGYMWTPGYWAWDPDFGYYWVPGTWVPIPFAGALWTPGYWAYDDGAYVWYAGYWGPVVGYYGGIDYGFGYTGYGYQGGYWRHDNFYYNRTVNNISATNIRHVYNKRVDMRRVRTRASYNGGPGGTRARPTSKQLAAARMRRRGPVEAQKRQMQIAQSNPQQRARINHGRPAIAATARPGAFSAGEAVQATRAGAPYKPPREFQRSHGAEPSMPASPGREHAKPNVAPHTRGAERSMPAARPAPRRLIPHETAPPRREQRPHVYHSFQPPTHASVQHAHFEHQPNVYAQEDRTAEQRRPERPHTQKAERPHHPGPPHGR